MHPETVKMLLALYGPIFVGVIGIMIYFFATRAEDKKEAQLAAYREKKINKNRFCRKKPRLAASRRKKAYKRRF
jgi:heme/copper-type cytochrome/quinol oxidase subunit 2